MKWLIFISAITFFQIFYIYIFFIEPNWIEVRQVEIVSTNLSKALSGIKVVQISDLEIIGLGYREVSLIEKINRLRPDLIFITGDLVGSREGINALWDLLSVLEPRFHTYVVLGDSDGVISNFSLVTQWDRANTYLLNDRAIRINLKAKEDSYLWIVGVQNIRLRDIIKDVPREEPIILLNHWPDIVKQAAIEKIDLVLAGHTHGGQVGIPLLWRFFPYAHRSNYISGLYRLRDTLLYVNRGITSEKGIRFLCRPEIAVFEFMPAGKMKYRILKQDR